MGAHFRLPLYDALTWPEIDEALGETAFVGTEMRAGSSIYQYRWPESACLLVGSEAHGLSQEGRGRVREWVHVPMRAGVESLNAAVAASVVIYAALGSSITS
jgi:tRNA G18 (ribose-2'-O)-methylase SpoU